MGSRLHLCLDCKAFLTQIFKKAPFFHGNSVIDQSDKIVAVLGAEELIDFMNQYELDFQEKFNVAHP
jgi:hypothetical protein